MNAEELKKSLEEVGKGIKASQEASEKAAAVVEGLDNETLKKMCSDTAELLETHQELKQSSEAQKAELERVEKLLSRTSNGSGDGKSEEEIKARREIAHYLKKSHKVSPESLDHIAEGIIKPLEGILSEEEKGSLIKSLVGSIPAQGGFFVRPEVSSRMITRIFETSPMRNSAAIESITGDTLEIIIDDNELTAGGWVGETATRSQTSTPDVGLKVIPVHEQFAQPAATQRMLDDAGFDVEGWLSRKVTSKMTRDENTAFVVGDGVGKPRGFLTYPAWAVNGTYERGAIEQIASAAASGTVEGDDFKKTQNSMIEEYNAGAAWYMKRASFENVITLKDSQGAYLLDPRSLKTGDDKVLLGKPVVFMDDMPDVAAGTLSFAYANFSMGYTIVDRIGFRVIRDDLTAKPYILFYTTKRTGGDVTNYESTKILAVAT